MSVTFGSAPRKAERLGFERRDTGRPAKQESPDFSKLFPLFSALVL